MMQKSISRNTVLLMGVFGGLFMIAFVRLAGLVADNAVDVPYGDQWDALRYMFEDQGPIAGFYQQHGPHRLGLASIIDWYLYRMTGWDVRAESWMCVFVLGLSALVAIHLSFKLRGKLSWRDAVLPLLILSPVSWETIILTPFLAHSILPLLLVMLLVEAWIAPTPKVRFIMVGVLSGIALFSGFGFSAAFASISLAILLCLKPSAGVSSRWQLMVPLGIFSAFAVWFACGYRWDPAVPGWCFPVAHWWDYPRFMALMFTSLLGMRSLAVIPTAAGALLLIAALVLWVRSTARILKGIANLRDIAMWLLVSTSLFYAWFTAVGRLPVNIEAAFMWRYAPLMMPAVVALHIAADEFLEKVDCRRFAQVYAALVIVVITMIWANLQPERNAATVGRAKRIWVETYLATNDMVAANAASNFALNWFDPTSQQVAARLDWLKARQLSFFRTTDRDPSSP